jgi:hypothetical protein
MSADALTHQKGTFTTSAAVILPLVLGESYLLICGLEGDDFNSQTLTPELFTGVNGGVKARGELTIDTNPIETDAFVIGASTYTFTAEGDKGEGKIPVSVDLPALKLAVIAAINGTDGSNSPNASATAIGWIGDVLTVEALATGTLGNAIVSTETFDEVTNVFDAAVLGTAQAGTDVFTNETAALPTPGSADSAGSPQAFADEGMIYFDAGLPNLLLQPSGTLTSVRYFLTKVGTFKGLNVGR